MSNIHGHCCGLFIIRFGHILTNLTDCTLCEKCPNKEFFWSVFSYVRTEHGELRSKSPYSVWTQENTDQKKLLIWTLFTQWHPLILIWVSLQSLERPLRNRVKLHMKKLIKRFLLKTFRKHSCTIVKLLIAFKIVDHSTQVFSSLFCLFFVEKWFFKISHITKILISCF